jgi:integral membrane protein (TIGR01906 family)
VKPSLAATVAGAVTALATAVVIVGLAVLVFLNPIWVGFEQDRSGVDRLTGLTPEQVRAVTGSILSDLIFGPPNFDVSVDGAPVLDARERSHMVDVRTLLGRLGLIAVAAAICVAVVGLASRGRRWFWRAVAAGAGSLLGGVVVVGLAFTFFFDQAFELFHRLFFAPGTYLFDAASSRLVQLFPEQFWVETSLAMAAVSLALAAGVLVLAGRLARGRGAASPSRATEVAG